MKKKLLFVMPSLSSGGGERSLVNLLTRIDYEAYEVDLFLFSHEGLFMEYVPKQVRLLPLPDDYRMFALPLRASAMRLLLHGKLPLAYSRLMFSLRNRYAPNVSVREQYNWKYVAKALGKLPRTYDAAIGFLEKTSTYFCVDKVEAEKKIGWVHIDYDELGMDPRFDVSFFEKLDHIVTVSEECAEILKRRFPEQRRKVQVIRNIVSPAVIRQMAAEEDGDLFDRRKGETVILSIGRLHAQKGFEMAVSACRILLDRGFNVSWHIIGEGDEREMLTKLIRSLSLEERFRLLGLKSNPYPYMKQADLYVQTSRFEGKSIAIDEAKIMSKPIVVTHFSTAADQIEDGADGLIVGMDPEAIADGIERLIRNGELRSQMSERLRQEPLGTEDEIFRLYGLLNETAEKAVSV